MTLKWNKKMCIEYSVQMRSYLEELMQQQQPQVPRLMQRLQAQPRRMKLQELMGGNGQGEMGPEMMEEQG